MGVPTTLTVAIATVIAHLRHFHPADTRSNDVLGKTIWRAAFKHDPITSKRLGRKPSPFAGFNGLPKTSHEIEVTPDTLAHLFTEAQKGLVF